MVHSLIARAAVAALRPGILNQRGLFDALEARGLHLTDARHYERPVPNTTELRRSYPHYSTPLGIDFNPDGQRHYLTQMLTAYVPEFLALPLRSNDPWVYSRDNDAFVGMDGLAYWSFIRSTRPTRVLEIGSGFSTLLARQALNANGSGTLTVVDPYPRPFLRDAGFGGQLIQRRVEDIELSFFEALTPGDILFVDTSHIVRTGGDVNHLFLYVFPRLPTGVLVHVHDIYLPFEYPAPLLLEDHRFWTEQYLLQAFLTENPRVQVEFGSQYCLSQFPAEVAELFPIPDSRSGASFWFTRR